MIYSSTEPYAIETIKAKLAMEEIDCTSINKMDSAYPLVGDIEIYVEADNVMKARHIISTLELE